MNKFHFIILVIFACASLHHVHADEAIEDKVKINSDKLTLDKNLSSATFQGDVVVRFDNMKLVTSKLVVFYSGVNNKQTIEKIIIPTKLKAVQNCDGDVIIADKGKYITKTKELTLTGNVKAKKDDHILVTDKLIYKAKLEEIFKQDVK